MKTIFFEMFSWNHQKHPRLRNVLKRMFTFSLLMHLAIVSGILYRVFSLWCSYVQKHEVYTIEYKNGQFNQCPNQTANVLSEEKVTNLRNYFSEISSQYKSQFLLLVSLIFLLFHFIESLTNCNNGVASLSNFVYGLDSQECLNQSKPEKSIELDNLDPEQVREMLKQDIFGPNQSPKSKLNYLVILFRGLMSLVGFTLLVLLYLSPMTFHLLEIDASEKGMFNLGSYTYLDI